MIPEYRNQLSEMINAADVSVRAASQLRLLNKGRAVRDVEAMESVKRIVEDAMAGGQFISTGVSSQLSGSLRPLTWVADIRFESNEESDSSSDKYDSLVKFLERISIVLESSIQDNSTDPEYSLEAAEFLQHLGDFLGSQADQEMSSVSKSVSIT